MIERAMNVVVLDLDGTLYPKHSSLGREIDARTEAFLLERTGWGRERLSALEKVEPSILRALDLMDVPRAEWTAAVHPGLPYECLRPDRLLRELLVERFSTRTLATLAPAKHAIQVLARLGLSHVINEVRSVFDEGGTTKHDIYAEIVHRHGTPEQILAIGDHPILDLTPAADLGCTCRLVGDWTGTSPFPSYTSLVYALHL